MREKKKIICICCEAEEKDEKITEQIKENFNSNNLSDVPYICPNCEKRLNNREFEALTGIANKKLHIRHKKSNKNIDGIV